MIKVDKIVVEIHAQGIVERVEVPSKNTVKTVRMLHNYIPPVKGELDVATKLLLRLNPKLQEYYDYFKAVEGKNNYIVALRTAVFRELLKDYDLSPKQIATIVGIDRATYYHYVNQGIQDHPDYKEVCEAKDEMISSRKYPIKIKKDSYKQVWIWRTKINADETR